MSDDVYAGTGPRAYRGSTWHAVRWDSLRQAAGRFVGRLRWSGADEGYALAGRRAAAAPYAPRSRAAVRCQPFTDSQRHLVTALEAALAGMGARRARTATPDRPYEVAEVLAPLVALGRTAGEPVRWSVPDGLYVHGHPDALAHVTLTLLANAARHAPGVPVTVDAAAAGGAVRVTVANPCTAEAGGGPGLGLRVCARMVVAEGGRMHVRPAAATPEPTWQVVVELPAAWRPDRSGA